MAQTSLHPISGSFFDSEPVRSQLLRRIRAFPRRVHEALVASRRARAEREVAGFIEAQGGRLTDNLEREILRRFGSAVL
jgi:hypothetical protein